MFISLIIQTLSKAIFLIGLTKLNTGKIVCTTEDYQINEVDLTIDENGVFQGLNLRKIGIPASPTMLCRGIATCYPYDGTAFFVLERYFLLYLLLSND